LSSCLSFCRKEKLPATIAALKQILFQNWSKVLVLGLLLVVGRGFEMESGSSMYDEVAERDFEVCRKKIYI